LALQDLNKLLINRYRTGTFTPISASSSSEALDIILRERKKEMVNRGVRWADLKRLNKEGVRAVNIKRLLNGTEYILPPNDARYTLLIPLEVIRLSDLPQNSR
jgi:hypothetical protein